jgi:APA family basic amino acid/polyamine antiporter
MNVAYFAGSQVLFGHVVSGLGSVNDFRTGGREASVALAIRHYLPSYEGWRS